LPDYAIVDKVLQGYVEEFLTPEEIVAKYDVPLDVTIELIRKIHAAEYKRQQAAPGIRVTKKAYRVGRRYPIVQGWV
jgi:NAD+ synthase (glutamine-hydrolysing)